MKHLQAELAQPKQDFFGTHIPLMQHLGLPTGTAQPIAAEIQKRGPSGPGSGEDDPAGRGAALIGPPPG